MISPKCPAFPAIPLDNQTYGTAEDSRRSLNARTLAWLAHLRNQNSKFPLLSPREVLKECSLGGLPVLCCYLRKLGGAHELTQQSSNAKIFQAF